MSRVLAQGPTSLAITVWLLLGEVMLNLFFAVAVWSSLGLLACVLFRRAGHNFLLFAGLAVWMGPFIVIVMRLVATEHKPQEARVLRVGEHSSGWLDVLVGVDGSIESSASVAAALESLRPALRRVRFAAVLDHETARNPDFFDTDEEIEQMLFETATSVGLEQSEIALLVGRADRALVSHAVAEGFDLVLVSHRHHPTLGTLLGSTVQRLARDAPVPVLVSSRG